MTRSRKGAELLTAYESGGYPHFKNRIINGAMMIDQRNAGASLTQPVNLSYGLDRWFNAGGVAGKFTIQQNAGSVTPPAGFKNYLGVTSTSAYTVGSGDLYLIGQSIEGYNIADLGWGAAGAQPITISFWVRSSLTGAFGGSVGNGGWLSNTRAYPFSYTISSANTWEYKTITIAGDTSGTWATNNAQGITVFFGLGVGTSSSGPAGSWASANYIAPTGATSVVGTNGATWYITGVQLEKGSTATSFDYRPYGTELALCQRYYWKNTAGGNNYQFGTGYTVTTTLYRTIIQFPVTMRASPSALEQSGTAGDYKGYFANNATTCSSVPTFVSANSNGSITQFTVASGLTAGQAGEAQASGGNGYLGWSAEL